jgi:hypothetical protein
LITYAAVDWYRMAVGFTALATQTWLGAVENAYWSTAEWFGLD